MPLVQCKCTNCGANLQVDNTKDAAICQYCGSAFVVEKAIHNYNVTNHITAEVVNAYGVNSADFVISAGKLEKYTGAATDVVIPNSVNVIGADVFTGTGLTSVTIPNSVTVIPAGAFDGCVHLTNVTIPNSVTAIEGSIRSFGAICVGAFSGCTSLTSIIIPNSVTIIGDCAFQGCTSLTSIIIPNSVTKIGDHALQGCTSLTSVTIPNSVTEIGGLAFRGCTSLTSVTIPNSVTEIGGLAFRGCTSLTSVTIPNSVTEIGGYAFEDCTSLTSVTIPNSVTEIGDSAFKGCTSLTSVTCPPKYRNSSYFPDSPNLWLKQKNKSGCYIATSVYGSYDCSPVWTLRRYRDYALAKTLPGRAFIRVYYAVSPTLVRWFGKTHWFQRFWRARLDRWVARLNQQGVEDTPYQD